MAQVEHLNGSSQPGETPTFAPITGEPAPAAITVPAFAGPDAELLALIAEAKVAAARTRDLSDQRDALCRLDRGDPRYKAVSDEWSASLDRLWAFWPKIAAWKATTAAGWMAKASLAIETPEEMAEVRANPDENELGGSPVNESIIMDLAEAFFSKQAESVAHLPAAALDAPLLEAWRQRQQVFERYEAASDLADWHLKSYATSGSALAELFRPRETDFVGDEVLAGRLPCDRNGFYTKAAVSVLRGVEEASPHHARALEIVQAFDAYSTPSAEHLASDADFEAVTAELHSFDDTIRDTTALSLEGIGVKASWALTHVARGERDLSEILRQVEAFAHRHRMPTGMAAVDPPGLDGLPEADWALYHLFTRWVESSIEVRALEAEEKRVFHEHGDGSEAWCKAEALATAESVRNEALRVGIVDMPAASLQGVRLKAHVYQWLCQTAEGGVEHGLTEARKGNRADDQVLAFAIARDMARLVPAACVSEPPSPAVPLVAEGDEPIRIDELAFMDFEPWPADQSRMLNADDWEAEFDVGGHHFTTLVLAAGIVAKPKPEMVAYLERLGKGEGEHGLTVLPDALRYTKDVLSCLQGYVNAAEARVLCAGAVLALREEGEGRTVNVERAA